MTSTCEEAIRRYQSIYGGTEAEAVEGIFAFYNRHVVQSEEDTQVIDPAWRVEQAV